MSRKQSTLRCKLENFEAIRDKWRKLGYKVYFRDLRYGDMVIAGKYKLEEKDIYTLSDCVNIVKQIKGVYYPPSGKYYEFSDGSTCEDWNLEFHIRDKLVEIEHAKKGVNND